MNIPNDPMILVSFLNTHLRDFYPSLEELCKTMNLSQEEITKKLKSIDYHYDPSINQFI